MARSAWDQLDCQLLMEYELAANGSVTRIAKLQAIPVRKRVIVPLFEQDSTRSLLPFWSRVDTRLTTRARNRFSPAFAQFWQLAPRLCAYIVTNTGPAGAVVRLGGAWIWEPAGTEKMTKLWLNVEGTSPWRRIYLRAEPVRTLGGMALRLRPGSWSRDGDDGLALGAAVPDEPAWAKARAGLAAKFEADVFDLLETFAGPAEIRGR